jgi:hypothetical protein
MQTLKQFALANWRKLTAWLIAGGAVFCLDQIKTGISNGTVVVPADWQGYVPTVLFVLTLAIAVLTPSHRELNTPPAPSTPPTS